MPTTTKGVPYPASTAPPNVPADLAALAQDLDFTKIPLLTPAQIPNATTLLSVYPLGVSLMTLSSTEAAAGGWPGGTFSNVLTIKTNAGRATQYLFRTSGLLNAYYRQLQPDPGPHSPWAGASGPYAQAQGAATLNLTTNPTASVTVTLPAGRFTQAPRVQLTPSSSLWMPSLVSAITATSFSVIARNILATTGTGTSDVHWLATQALSSATDG
jgi:hypothetical protein